MQTVLIVIHLMIVLALVVVVLLQKSEGGALGIGGGGGFMAGRGQSNPLSRLTAYLAGGFFATSMALTILAGYGGGSVFDRLQPTGAARQQPATAPGGPQAPLGSGSGGILNDLKKIQGQGAGQPPQPSGAAPQAAAQPGQPPQPAADGDQPKFDAVPSPQGDANTAPRDADQQQPGGAQTAPMPQDAQPVAPQVSDPKEAGGNDGVKHAPAQPAAPEGAGNQPAAPTAGPAAPSGGQ
ncbi:preprotein translocase subunit SecG [Chelatococcus sambhunathii]|uniref:Protein-export membrane protein SecG n=1 Tax=Chelatococcus sambhunathii TaxID=363953 RepID=A0ABU1DG43_9HYPH|nr:preprotein translocase subunit SecG [Chelatococcus sambhunathii]